MRKHKVTAYLVLEKGARPLDKPVLVKRVTTKKPQLGNNQIAFKMNLLVPVGIFEEILPTVNIDLPATLALVPDIEAEVLEFKDDV